MPPVALHPPTPRYGPKLPPVTHRLVLHWGEMGSRWGVNRTVSQVHALLYLAGRPLAAEEIADKLMIARSNVSVSLRELVNWNLARVVHRIGDRRDHYETAQDPWTLLRVIVRERKAREFEPTIAVLRDCLGDAALVNEDPATQARMRETLALMESLSGWSEEMLRLEPATLTRLMKLGARIAKLLGSGAPPTARRRQA